MEVKVRPDHTGTEYQQDPAELQERMRRFGDAALDMEPGIRIGDATRDALATDAWEQFRSAGEEFCSEFQAAKDHASPVLDEATLRNWTEQARRISKATQGLLALATEGQPPSGE